MRGDRFVLEEVDLLGNVILLTGSVWQDIQFKHPEVTGYLRKIIAVIKDPVIVVQSISNPRVHLYYRFFEGIFREKYLVVVVKSLSHKENYISTVYVTDKRKGGKIIWQAD